MDKGEGESGGAGWGRARGERRSRAGGEKGKEAEVPGGHGARAGSGEGRRAGAPEKRPDFLPARARKPESGHRTRDRRVRPRAPRRSPPRADTRYTVPGPARPPPPPPPGEEQGGDRALRASQGAPAVVFLWPRFSHLSKRAKRKPKEKTRRGGARLSSQKLGSRDRRIVMSSKSAWAI